MLKEACGSFNFTLTAVPTAQQQAQPVLPQTISSGFAGSAFGPAAGLPLEPLCGGVPRPSVISGASLALLPCSHELRLVHPANSQWAALVCIASKQAGGAATSHPLLLPTQSGILVVQL